MPAVLPGFSSIDSFNASLYFKRVNQEFPFDSSLLVPYDNVTKLIPESFMPISLNNELLILRAHDPIRNYNRFSFAFVNILKSDFIGNHIFSPPKLTYQDSKPYYYITFTDAVKYKSAIHSFETRICLLCSMLGYPRRSSAAVAPLQTVWLSKEIYQPFQPYRGQSSQPGKAPWREKV